MSSAATASASRRLGVQQGGVERSLDGEGDCGEGGSNVSTPNFVHIFRYTIPWGDWTHCAIRRLLAIVSTRSSSVIAARASA